MTIDIHSIKPGGKVSVTLSYGLKIVDAEVSDGNGVPWIRLPSLPIYHTNGIRNAIIVSVDAYTPPVPGWDRPDVFAIRTRHQYTIMRDSVGAWPFSNSTVYEGAYGPCTVLALYADEAGL